MKQEGRGVCEWDKEDIVNERVRDKTARTKREKRWLKRKKRRKMRNEDEIRDDRGGE